jgi:hypothetical protein
VSASSDPAGVVKDALEQYPDLPDEEIIGVGPEDYILRRLHQAGYSVVRIGACPHHSPLYARFRRCDCRDVSITEEWAP